MQRRRRAGHPEGTPTRRCDTSQDQRGWIRCEAFLGAEPVALIVPGIGKRLELVLVLARVVRAEEKLAAAHRGADIRLGATAVTAIERCEWDSVNRGGSGCLIFECRHGVLPSLSLTRNPSMFC